MKTDPDQIIASRVPQKPEREYWTYTGNEEQALRNGSFVRKSKHGYGRFMNGDFIDFVADDFVLWMRDDDPTVPLYTKVGRDYAEKLLPECCV